MTFRKLESFFQKVNVDAGVNWLETNYLGMPKMRSSTRRFPFRPVQMDLKNSKK